MGLEKLMAGGERVLFEVAKRLLRILVIWNHVTEWK
jgi:hypothetical protein